MNFKMKDNLEVNKQKLGIDSWLKLIEEDKNLNGAYISIGQYIWLLEKELEKLNNINKEYERLNKENGRGFKITSVKQYNIDELIRCKDNWNELKKWLEENESLDDYCNETTFTSVLEKMLELEGSDNQ